jgi:hypothetical protein
MMRRFASTASATGALLALLGGVACGDVTSDLITGSSAGSSGASPGGAGGLGGAGAGSSAGGAGAGTGGTPECTGDADCMDSDRNLCDVTQGRCVECTNEGPCDIEEDCNLVVGECGRRCASPADCIEPDDPVCAVNGFCVECQEDDDCPSSEQCANWQCFD